MNTTPHLFLALLLLLSPASGAKAADAKVDPVYPPEVPGLVFWEAEDAVATNFGKTPVLDYASSRQRTLILNSPTAPYGGMGYYAQYVVWVAEPGEYELWYAGTPPGPRDDQRASYASPLSLTLDQGPVTPLAREEVNVVEAVTLSQYWVKRQATLTLTAGPHTLVLKAVSPRRSDGRYYFNLDALFLRKTTAPWPDSGTTTNPLPQDPQNRAIDNPFLTLAQYDALVAGRPQDSALLLEVAKVHSLIGSYTEALKFLSKARFLDPANPGILLALAKNQIWAGETEDAYRSYRSFLDLQPRRADVWAELGKLQAWQGKIPEALATYRQALEKNPGDLTLAVNAGLTAYWGNQVSVGDRALRDARADAGQDQERWAALGGTFETNGYPDRSVGIYAEAAKKFPGALRFPLLQMASLVKTGKDSEAERVRAAVVATYQGSDRLTGYLQTFSTKLGMKQAALEELRRRLAASPDDLDLREVYIDALFWNGKKALAVQEHINVLVSQLYRAWTAFDQESAGLNLALDRWAAAEGALIRAEAGLAPAGQTLAKTAAAFRSADAEAARWAAAEAKKPLTEVQASQRDAALTIRASALADRTKAEAEAGRALALAGSALGALEALRSDLGPLAEVGRSDADRLSRLGTPQRWSWDKAGTLLELESAGRSGVWMGPYLQARIAEVEGRNAEALSRLTALPSLTQVPLEALGARLRLRMDPAGHAPPPVADGPPVSADEWLRTLPPVQQRIKKEREAARQAQTVLREAWKTKMLLMFLAYDEASTTLRFQIGEEAIDLGDLAEARRQLDKVTAARPWDSRAQYRLGNVSQLQGDWSTALGRYRTVFLTDTRYPGAAGLFNDLAKAHPEVFESQLRQRADTGREVAEGSLSYRGEINPWVAYRFDAAQTRTKLLGTTPRETDLLSARATLPLSWGFGVLRLVPSFGVLGRPPSWRPAASLDLGWTPAPPVTWSVRGAFQPVSDTLDGSGAALTQVDAESTLSTYFALPPQSWLSSVSSRTFGQVRTILEDGNRLTTAVQEAVFGFHLADAPWTGLTLAASGTWEGSAQASAQDRYYTPGGNVSAKVTVGLDTTLGLPGRSVLGFAMRGGGGPYGLNLLRGTDGLYWNQEASVRLDWTKGDATVFIEGSGARTLDEGGAAAYWSLEGFVGFRLALADRL